MGSKGTHIGKYVADRFTGHIGQGSTAHLLGKKLVSIEQPWTLLWIHIRTQSYNIS